MPSSPRKKLEKPAKPAAFPPRDVYSTLRLHKTATPAEIRRAYRQMALEAHPDRPSGSTSDFLDVRLAYEVLNDPQRRAAADAGSPAFSPSPRSCRHLADSVSWEEARRFATREEAENFVPPFGGRELVE
eukprot:TRINITY_DN14939_c0_g2_i1.p1 TRINITY_DN14939_c0_g2~~TRINITY_DN14939_c0_g2_i1.p1  ORF type:complete len:142 (+),score=27.33 TRINITY_DN14939_c0_g2_i1:37-426(+)